ncbi:complement factor H-like isoform X2 [Eleutherodactylus coqui]|uniref:complement factor H-like isoform X2 n=1 Tax=Eleutherodactylus coqui TaxID=57060 RepID=UPI0034628871
MPSNAEIIDPKEAYYNNDNVNVRCNRGYKMLGSSVIQCIDGRWEQPPECIRLVPCKNPPTISNGNILESSKQDTYVTDDVVKYGCKSGFHISGSDQSTCLNGQWTTSPKCTVDPCDEAPEVSHGTVQEKKKTFNHGESAKYICDNGFRISGEDSASCVEGKWLKIPTCIATSCEPPPAVRNSILSEELKDSYASGEKVTYTCNRGYSLERSLRGEAQCENTQWMNVPVCRKIGEQCGPPPTVQFGDTTGIRKPSYKSGESVEYRCPNYYILKGEKVVRCMNGVWEEAPVCLEPCTAKEKDMEENRIQLRWRDYKKIYLRHGEEVEFVCKPEHEAPPGTLMRPACQQGKLQYPKCFRNGFCVLQQATMIPNNINSNTSNVVDPGQTIIFQCNEGMMPDDKLEAKCEKGNINYPKCSFASKSAVYAESCQTPEIVNGFLATEQQDSYDSGSSVAFWCNENYVINGPINAKCENGQWIDLPVCYRPCRISSEGLSESNIQLHSFYIQKSTYDSNYKHGTELLVSCKPGFKRPNQALLKIACYDGKFKYPRCFSGTYCEPPPAVQNAILNEQPEDSYASGEKVTYTCNGGYSLEGSLTGEAQCQSTQWINVPVCRKIGEQCGPPPTIQFGDTLGIRKPSYKSGESVEYRCPNYHILKGEKVVRCMNGVWEEAPVCLEIGEQCGPPPTVQFGDTLGIRKPSYKSGESVEYRCPNYHILKGEKVVRCMNGVWEEAPVCLEPCTAKEKDMEENRIQLRWVSDKKVYSKHGDETEFVCKPEHEAPPGTLMKTTCQQGKLQYPKCFRNGFCVLQQATMITNNINSNMNNVVDHEQTIRFQCNEGMMPEDKLEAKCESGNINYPKCSSASKSAVYAESCQTPEIVNGFLATERQDSYNSGSSVAFECNENYVINGPINAKCENGQWTDLPVCYRPCKISSEGLSESNIQLHSFYIQKSTYDSNYKHGTELLVSCKPGFKRPNQALLKIICYDGKFKYPRCFSGNICRITQEGLDQNNLDLHEVHDNEVLYMECEKIYFKCKNGFYHWGQPTGTCAELAVSYPKCSASSSV